MSLEAVVQGGRTGMMMRFLQMALVLCIAAAGLGVSTQSSSAATLRATIDLSRQRMTVHVNGVRKYRWVVSTGKDGWLTKPGVYQPFAQREKFYSQKWKMSLPYLTFIGQDGTAIHGTYLTKKLGRRASHGCIRLSISNAQKFYKLVQEHGFWGTEVVVKR